MADFRIDIVNFKGDTSYVNPGGRAGTAAAFGFARILAMVPLSHKGYVWEYDPATDKILFSQQSAATGALTEVPNATNLSAITYRALVIGQ
jgi:hypothetical protein